MEIILKNIRLQGFHGVHPLENIVGTSFMVNLKVRINADDSIETIEQTIDYAMVFDLLKSEFAKTEKLLEVLAERIIRSIWMNFALASEIDLEILKLNPPIEGFLGEVGVHLKKRRNEV